VKEQQTIDILIN